MKFRKSLLALLLVPALLSSCGTDDTPEPAATGPDPVIAVDPVDEDEEEVEEETYYVEEDLEVVYIDFWHLLTGAHIEPLTYMIDAFHAYQDRVRVVEAFQGNAGALNTALTTSFLAGTAPHIGLAVASHTTDYITNDFIVPLSTFFVDAFSQSELADIVHLELRNTREGEIWSSPFGISTRILFYNREVLDEFGLEAPVTWDDVRNIAEVTTDGDRFGMGWENAFWSEFVALLEQHGGTYVNETTARSELNSPAGIAALSFIHDLIDDGFSRTAGEDGFMSGVFGSGSVTMYIGSSAGLAPVTTAVDGAFEWGTMPTPGTGTTNATLFAGNDIVMFNESARSNVGGMSEREMQAAWEFIEFTLRPEITAIWANQTGYLPTRYSSSDLPIRIDFLEENPTHLAGSAQIPYGFYLARVHGMTEVQNNALMYYLDQVIPFGLISVEEALANAEERANEILAEAN